MNFWKMSHRYSLDFPPLDDLRRALAGEPGRGDPYMFFGFHQRIAADLNDDSYGRVEE